MLYNIVCPSCGRNFKYYKINNKGDVWSDISNKFLKPHKVRLKGIDNSYLRVGLLKSNGIQKLYYVHQLVIATFKEKRPNKKVVNHIDGNKFNNHADNLEWVTSSENNKHTWISGINIKPSGAHSPLAALSNSDAIKIWHLCRNKVMPQEKIAKLFGVSRSTVLNIHLGKTYRKEIARAKDRFIAI